MWNYQNPKTPKPQNPISTEFLFKVILEYIWLSVSFAIVFVKGAQDALLGVLAPESRAHPILVHSPLPYIIWWEILYQINAR